MKFNYKALTVQEAAKVKRTFLRKFTDTTLPWYRAAMGFRDSYGVNAREGFVWEVLRPYVVISRARAVELISELSEVYIMWDNGSAASLKKEYREKLPKESLISANGKELAEYLSDENAEFEEGNLVLPNVLYVFPHDLSHHITLTGDSLAPLGQLCITNLTDLAETGIPPAYQEVFEIARLGKPLKNNKKSSVLK
ncbi:MAG: hypothetical protein IJO64_06040 [Clostridia bacterium]|nr:hypothetical protein [Clostridia bacterium]